MSAFSKMLLVFCLVFFSPPSSGDEHFPLDPYTISEKILDAGLKGMTTMMTVHHEDASGKMYQNGGAVACDDDGNCAVDSAHPHCMFMASGEHMMDLTLMGAHFYDQRHHAGDDTASAGIALSMRVRAMKIEAEMANGKEGHPVWDPATFFFKASDAPHATENRFRLEFDHGALECVHPLGMVMMAEDLHHMSGGALELH